jgi:hypothetical protein
MQPARGHTRSRLTALIWVTFSANSSESRSGSVPFHRIMFFESLTISPIPSRTLVMSYIRRCACWYVRLFAGRGVGVRSVPKQEYGAS